MSRESSYYEFALEPGEAVSLCRTAGWEIAAVGGRVWLTEEAGGEDVWLAEGERFVLSRPGRTVIEADGAAVVRLCLPANGACRAFAAGLVVALGRGLKQAISGVSCPAVPARS